MSLVAPVICAPTNIAGLEVTTRVLRLWQAWDWRYNSVWVLKFWPSVLRFVWVKSSVRITIHEHFRATRKE
ncbi:hypothetical protein ACFX2I_031870 [Malus domestica]